MSIKKDPSGKRSIQVEVEVPGTPEEVWQAIASGPGITSWFVPASVEERDGKPVTMKLDFGPGFGEFSSPITLWDPPRKYIAEGSGWGGSPPIADEWTVEALSGGMCVVRVVQSMFANSDDWDNQLEGTESGWPSYFRILRLYLTHFRGLRSSNLQWMVPHSGSLAEAWGLLSKTLNLQELQTGMSWSSPADIPMSAGVVEYVGDQPRSILIRLNQPGPGIAAFSAAECAGMCLISLCFYYYGDHAAETAGNVSPLWQSVIQNRLSSAMPSSPVAS